MRKSQRHPIPTKHIRKGKKSNDKEIENYSIEINKGDRFVNKTDLHADVIFEEKELVKLLTTGFIWNEINKPDNRLKSAPSDWFPLPFFLPEADSF